MAARNHVLKSINFEGESRCVDLFKRPDGTFGFEEFRRDFEDGRGWFPVGVFGYRVFDSEEDAWLEARLKISWLVESIKRS